MDEANREDKASDSLTKGKFEALDSQASFDRVLFDGGEFGTGGEVGSEDELDFLGIPGLLDAEQVGTLLRQRQHEQLNRKNKRAPQAARRRGRAGRAGPPDADGPAQRAGQERRGLVRPDRHPARRGPHQAARRSAAARPWPRPTRSSCRRGCGSSRTGSSAGSSRRRHPHRAGRHEDAHEKGTGVTRSLFRRAGVPCGLLGRAAGLRERLAGRGVLGLELVELGRVRVLLGGLVEVIQDRLQRSLQVLGGGRPRWAGSGWPAGSCRTCPSRTSGEAVMVLMRAQVSSLVIFGGPSRRLRRAGSRQRSGRSGSSSWCTPGIYGSDVTGKDSESTVPVRAAASSGDVDAAEFHLGEGVVEVLGDPRREAARPR